jgi:hypothetical protein
MSSFVVYECLVGLEVGTKVLAHDGYDWARKFWSARGMSGHKSVSSLRACLIYLLQVD